MEKKALSVFLAAFLCIGGAFPALAADPGSPEGIVVSEAAPQAESSLPSFEELIANLGEATETSEDGWAWYEDSKTLVFTGDTGDFTSSNYTDRSWNAYAETAEILYCNGTAGSRAFRDFDALKSLVIYGSIGENAFWSCDNLEKASIQGAEVIGESAFKGSNALRGVFVENCGSIGKTAFDGKGLSRVTINGYEVIEPYAFDNSTDGYVEIDIRGNDGKIYGNAFYSAKLGDVSITGGSFEPYEEETWTYYPFADVERWNPGSTLTLDGVTVPENGIQGSPLPDNLVVRNSSIGYSAFTYAFWAPYTVSLENSTVGADAFAIVDDTTSLESVSITGGSLDVRAFAGNAGLKKLSLTNVESIGIRAFSGSGLTSVTLTGNGTVENSAFANSENLKEVVVDGNVTVGQQAFDGCPVERLEFTENCTSIRGRFGESVGENTTIVIPDTVTSIGSSAFVDCLCLKGIVDLTGVKYIGSHAFDGCSNITELIVDADAQIAYSDIYPETVADWESRVKDILSGKFLLDAAEEIAQIASDGWTSAKTGTNNGLDYGDTQLVKEAKWSDEERTVADVQIKAYYTAEKQMDFVFVMDCTDSMSVVGSPEEDQYAKFYDMQSKLLDVTTELLSAGSAYDCRVAFAGYGARDEQHFTSGKFFDKADLDEAKQYIYGIDSYESLTNISLGLDEALQLVRENKKAGRSTAVILISDGTPNQNGEDFSGFEDGYYGYDEAAAIRAEGAEIYGVLHALSGGNVDERAKEVMSTICGDTGSYFVSHDTESFSKAVNDAIVAVYGEYVLTDVVDPAFELDEESIVASAGDVSLSQDENGNTVITWKISGMPFTLHTLTFKENLKQVDGEYPYGLFDTNEGDAELDLFEEPVNTVPTPQLPREGGEEEIPDESTPLTPPSSGGEDPTEEIPDESTPLAPATGEGVNPVWMFAAIALLALCGSAALLCKKKESCKK